MSEHDTIAPHLRTDDGRAHLAGSRPEHTDFYNSVAERAEKCHEYKAAMLFYERAGRFDDAARIAQVNGDKIMAGIYNRAERACLLTQVVEEELENMLRRLYDRKWEEVSKQVPELVTALRGDLRTAIGGE